MRRALLLTVAFGLIALFGHEATAQMPMVPYLSHAGLPTAQSVASDSLNDPNPILVTVLGFGVNPIDGSSGFDMNTGTSSFWAYMYYSSETGKAATVMVLQPFSGMFAGIGAVVDSAEGTYSDTMRVNTGLSYANSDMMAQQIRGNAQFQSFQSTYPEWQLDMASLLKSDIVLEDLPAGWPAGEPNWIVMFSDGADSVAQLICLVSAFDGQSYCVDAMEPGGVGAELATSRGLISVRPNPASGHTRVTVTAPTSGRSLAGTHVGLYDGGGRMVLDLTESFARNGYQSAEFDARLLPAGSYFCRAAGSDWNGVIGVIVVH